MSHWDDQLAEFRRACDRRFIYPCDIGYFLRHFDTRSEQINILYDMVSSGVLVFDGRDFWMDSQLQRFNIQAPKMVWGEGDLLHARCFDADRSTPPRATPRKGGEASIPAGL